MLNPALTRRAPLWSGRVDCCVVAGGRPVILRGRTATLEARQVVDACFKRTPPMFLSDGGDVYECRDAEAFTDALFGEAIGKPWEHPARVWLRELVARGGEELRRFMQEIASQ